MGGPVGLPISKLGNKMNTETYTPGHTKNATDFMSKRTLESHGQFFTKYLHKGHNVLDCGCGPGTITLDIATVIHPGNVTGVDFSGSQIERAKSNAAERRVENVTFQIASCYSLPFADSSFDCIFCHALMEHLSEPVKSLRELFRVLEPGGYIGVCSPDFGGLLLAPASDELAAAVSSYASMQKANGGDLHIGHKFGAYLSEAGFKDIQMGARYENYPSLTFIGEYLALQLEQKGHTEHAQTFLEWSKNNDGMFAQAWVSATGSK
jgi:ubiquinone/menaquinone biosynthesis C-methylase UbiE